MPSNAGVARIAGDEAKGGHSSKKVLAKEEAGLKVAQAEEKIAQMAVDHCTLRAPCAGRILAYPVSSGQYVAKGSTVADLADVANVDKNRPRDFISEDGFGITEKCRRYLEPLIVGEDYPTYRHGLPVYATLKNVAVARKLAEFAIK